MDWCWSWNTNTLATSCEELTHWKRPWCWEGLWAGAEGDDRGWDGWMASLTRWAWVWVNSRSCWWTRRPGMLWFKGLQRVGHDWATELNWVILNDIEWANRWAWCSVTALKQVCSGCQNTYMQVLEECNLVGLEHLEGSGQRMPKNPLWTAWLLQVFCSVIIHRLTGFISDQFRLYCVQGAELYPMELRE